MATPQGDEQEATGAAASGGLSRYPAAIALGGGVAAAFGSSFIPMSAIEGFVTAYGIAELLPAAAPPLGDTARLALSAGIGTLTAGALLALLPRAENEDMGFQTAIKKASDTDKDSAQPVTQEHKSSKLAGWLRTLRFGKSEPAPGTITDFADLAAPRIRNGDQHPDAPVRAPIRASADLGAPLDTIEPVMPEAGAAPLELGEDMAFAPPQSPTNAPSLRFAPASPVEPEPEDAVLDADEADKASLEAPGAAAAFGQPFVNPVDDEQLHEISATDEPAPEPSDEAVEASITAQAESLDDLDTLSTAELLDRLESGLARRRAAANAARTADAAEEPGGRVLSLARPTPPAFEGAPAPFKLRLGDPVAVQADTIALSSRPEPAETARMAAPGETAIPEHSVWGEDLQYLPPAVAGLEPESAAVAPEPAPSDAETGAATPADDDMDAALRDALATLRQLSDKQRSG